MALGARTGFFGMKDVEELRLTAKTLGDAIHLRNWAIEMLETAAVERDPAVRAELLTFVVAGGGMTGVEIAGEINDLVREAAESYPNISQRDLRVILVEAMPRLMPEFDEKLAAFALQRLRAAGVEVRLNYARQRRQPARGAYQRRRDPFAHGTLVWTTGVAPNPFIAATDLPRTSVAGLP